MLGSLNLPPLYTEMRVKIDSFKSEMSKAATYATTKASEITKSMNSANKVADRMVSFGKKATTAVTAPITAASLGVFKFAKDYENAFAGVRKTTDATEEEYQKISNGIRNMAKEMPPSAVSIAEVAEAAGQLGIKKEDILKFSKTMVDLGVSTNMSATEAATSLARFSNIMGTSSDNVDRLGSTIVHLGNNTATTEKEIVDLAMRLAGAGKQVGLTEAQVLGLSAAMSSVGVEAEMGGSAMSKLLVQMKLAATEGGEALDQFAKASGVSASEFKGAFEKDAAGALQMFLKGLKNSSKEGKSAIEILSEMGIEEVRLRDVILRAAEANEQFGETLNIANQGWRENTALQKEAEQRYKTNESQLKIAKNRLIDVAITLGQNLLPKVNSVLNVVGKFANTLSEMSPTMQSVVGWTTLAAAAIGPLTLGVGKAIKVFTTLKAGVGAASTFIKTLMKKDLDYLGKQSSKTATEYGKNSNKIVNETNKVKSSFSQIGSRYKIQSDLVVSDSNRIISQLKAIQLEARNTSLALKSIDLSGARKGKVTPNKSGQKTKDQFDTKGIDVYTSKTKKLGDTAKTTGDKVKRMGDSTKTASTVIKTSSTKVSEATGKVAKNTGMMSKVLSKGSSALKILGKGAMTAAPLLLDVGLGLGGTATAAAGMGGSLLAGAGALGSLAVAAAPAVAAGAAVAAVGYGVYQAFKERAVPAVDLYKSKTEMVFNESTGRMEQHTVKISEETKKQYQHFYDMTKNIKQAAEGMYLGLYKNAEDGHRIILENAEQYKNSYIEKVNKTKDETISKFNELYGNSTSISAETKANLIKDAEETAQETIKSAETRFTEITRLSEELKTAVGTDAEEIKNRIIKLTQEQDFETINIVAKNKAEQEMLFNNLYLNVDNVTKEHVSEMIKKINDLRDNSVNAAKETRDKQIKYAEEWKARKEIINGKLTKEEEETYKKMKNAAVEGYAKATQEAEGLRMQGLDKLQRKYGDFDGALDYNTGKIKSWARQVGESIGLVNRTDIDDKHASFIINWKVYEETIRLDNQAYAHSNGGKKTVMSARYNGLDYVPYDGYHARLHRGERVLTAEENKEFMLGRKQGDINVNIDKVYNNSQNDARKVAQQLALEIRKQRLGGGIA